MKIPRRAFLVLVLATLVAAIVWLVRRVGLAKEIQEFYGFDDHVLPFIESQMKVLQTHDALLFRDSALFFTLARYRARSLLPRSTQKRIISYWSTRLLQHRSVFWPYVYYPSVQDLAICDGLIH